MIICLAAIIIPGQSGTYRHLRDRVTGLLADSGLNTHTNTTGYGVIAQAPEQQFPYLTPLTQTR